MIQSLVGRAWPFGALLVIGLALYAGALDVGFYYDDRQAIVRTRRFDPGRRLVVVATGSAASAREDVPLPMYRPVTLASYAADYALWG
jgi:hypothetical protein